jgi:hypothetical protein
MIHRGQIRQAADFLKKSGAKNFCSAGAQQKPLLCG